MLLTDTGLDPALAELVDKSFGLPGDSMEEVERRANELLGAYRPIVWEGDAATFEFSYVGKSAEAILGYPCDRWTTEPTFWADIVVHPDDRTDAIAFCAVATGKCLDHDFIYRAVRADNTVATLHDIVRVIRGRRDVAERLRGIMLELPAGESSAKT
jgi:PAS domain-containing protein